MSNKGCTLFKNSKGVEPQIRGGCSRAPGKETSREVLWCTLFEWEVRLESVVKGDSGVEQRVYFVHP